MHVGTFTPEGTFAAIIPRLDALRELGITAIELMPVGQFPGGRGWGYDGVYWFAVQNSYGGPHELQRLVDACHGRGIAVLLDVIYNHLGPEGNYLPEYGPYITDRHSTPWGGAINYDDANGHGVRRFVLENVRHWIHDFHLDGLRLDAVHAIHDTSSPDILAEIERVATDPSTCGGRVVHVIAESNLNDVRQLAPRDFGGIGLHAQWNDDFHHCVHALLTGERAGYYQDFSDPARQLTKSLNQVFVYDGCYSSYRDRKHGTPAVGYSGDRFVVSIQTHDQVGNRALGERLHALVESAEQRLAAGLLLLSPYIPLLFMGEEYGEIRPFPFFCDLGDPNLQEAVRRGRREEFAKFNWGEQIPDPCALATFESARLTWQWELKPHQVGLRKLYGELLRLRRVLPEFRDFAHRRATLETDDQRSLLVLSRGNPNRDGQIATAVFNLTPTECQPPVLPGNCLVVLCSELLCFGGSLAECVPQQWMQPFEFRVYGTLDMAAANPTESRS